MRLKGCALMQKYRQKHLRQTIGLLAGLMLGACAPVDHVVTQTVDVHLGSQAEVRTVASDYLPGFQLGQKWVYRVSTDAAPQEVSYEVVSVKEGEVVQKVTVRATSGQQIGEELVSLNRFGVPLNTKTSLSQSLSFGGGFAGPRTQLNQAVNLDGIGNHVEVHQSASSGGNTVSQEIAPLKFGKTGSESVTVAAGTYTADLYTALSSESYPRIRYQLWLVKQLGEVKSSQQTETSAGASGSLNVRELKSFSGGAGR